MDSLGQPGDTNARIFRWYVLSLSLSLSLSMRMTSELFTVCRRLTRIPPRGDVRVSGRAHTPSWVYIRDGSRADSGIPPAASWQLHSLTVQGIEEGTHSQLLELGGTYAMMWNQQKSMNLQTA
jgi:hypothetical protein